MPKKTSNASPAFLPSVAQRWSDLVGPDAGSIGVYSHAHGLTMDKAALEMAFDKAFLGSHRATMQAIALHPEYLVQACSRGTLLDGAFSGKQTSLAIDLIALGAWCSLPARHGSTSARPATPALPFEESLEHLTSQIAMHTPDGASVIASMEALQSSGRPCPGELDWALSLCLHGRFDSASDLIDLKDVALTADFWKSLRELENKEGRRGALRDFLKALVSCHDPRQREGAWLMLELNPEQVPKDLLDTVWRFALAGHNAFAVDRLVRSGMHPPTWLIGPPMPEAKDLHPQTHAWTDECSILALAGAMAQPSIFRAFLALPEAVQACLDFPQKSAFLAESGSDALTAMARLKASISSQDENGNNLLHLWAQQDVDCARPGWPAIAKLRPEMIQAKNHAGHTPEAMQKKSLDSHPKRLAAFSAMMARAERGQIKKGMGAKDQAAKAKAPRL